MTDAGGGFAVGALLFVIGCTPGAQPEGIGAGAGGADMQSDGGSGGATSAPSTGGGSGDAGQGGTGSTATGGTGGSDAPAGGTGGAAQGGAGGAGIDHSDAGGRAGGSSQGGTGGSDPGGIGGSSGGSDAGQGGSDQGGTGGSDVGGSSAGGSDQSGTGGSDVGQGGTGDPAPVCTEVNGGTCDGLLYKECDGGDYFESLCDFNCEDNRGCFGECTNGDVRCSDTTAQACVDGEWTTTAQCAFHCVNGACEGACAPGAVVCDGLSTVTCGSDFHYGSPAACPTDPNGTTTCTDGECDLQPIACSAGTADCDGNWSCEADLTSLETCGSCETACDPNPAHASATCTVSGCGFSCDEGFADCDGIAANGCEQNIATDALNCGACGASCYGTTCDAGSCEYSFEVVSDYSGESTEVLEMALSATHVYWLTATELRRAPKAGGDYETLATLTTAPSNMNTRTGLVVEAGKAAWATNDGVYVLPEAGGTATRVFTTTGNAVVGLAGANGKLYWNDSQVDTGNDCITPSTFNDQTAFLTCNGSKATRFRTYDLGTSTLSSWQIAGSEYSAPLAVVGNEMVVGDYQASYTGSAGYEIRIQVFNATTGAWLRQIGGTLRVNGVAESAYLQLLGTAVSAAGTVIYSGPLHSGDAGSGIVSAPLAGGDQLLTNQLLTTVQSREIAVDATTVYFRDSAARSLSRVSLQGVTAAPVFVNEASTPVQLAVDDTYIYFTADTNGGEQAILRASK